MTLRIVRLLISVTFALSFFVAGSAAQTAVVGGHLPPAQASDYPAWDNAGIIGGCTDIVALPVQNQSSYTPADRPDFGSCDDIRNGDLIDEFLGGEPDFQSGNMMKLGILGSDDSVDQTVWYPLADVENVSPPEGDSTFSGYQITDASSNPLTWTQVIVRAKSIDQSIDPIVGGGITDDNGDVQVVMDQVGAVAGDPAFETANGDIEMDVYSVDSSGGSTYQFTVPENFGAFSSTDDPVLLHHKVLDAADQPLGSTAITVTAVPIDTTSWPANESYPTVGGGLTDLFGYAEATLDTGLNGIQNNPAFETEAGHITLAVNYTDANGNTVQAFTAEEDLSSYYDPVLQQQTLTAPDSSVLANTSLVVNAEPQYTSSWPDDTTYQQLATCSTDSQGHPDCSLDLSSVQGNAGYESNGTLTYDVWYYDSSHQLHFGFRAQEYVGTGWDQTLQQQTVTDSDGDPVANSPIRVTAVPVDTSTWTGDYPVVGTGTSDSSGSVDVTLSPGNLLNDPAFSHDSTLTLQVQWQDSNANWNDGPQTSESFAPNSDPLMQQHQVVSGSNSVADTPVLIRAEPVSASSCTDSCPQVGIGATDDRAWCRQTWTSVRSSATQPTTLQPGHEIRRLLSGIGRLVGILPESDRIRGWQP